ncbi:FAD-binding domain-containing protein [Hypoxylon sp. FL0890]|nr:FAD-binding domain-containing protein [Hypoxylon sp. FL0890]
MASSSFISLLTSKLSSSSKVLQDATSTDFAASMARWSNVDVKTPFAIVQPASQEDVVVTVREALKAGIPFVPASGGHSPWSTIGTDGIVIDLALCKGVEVDPQKNLVTVKGDTPFTGYGCENIVSAKLGIQGAGQFLGLVTELTIKTYPYSILGNDNGKRMCSTYIFPPTQLNAVCAVLRTIAESSQYVSAGHLMIVQAPPDLKQQVLLVAPQVFCSAEDAAVFLQPLVEIGPIQQLLFPSSFENHSNHLDWICAKGDFKRFNQIGLPTWTTEGFRQLAELHAELVAGCPDAARSGYTLEWHTPCKAERQLKSSFGHEDVDYWLNVLSWYTDEANHEFVSDMDQRAQAAMRAGTHEEAFISYTNTTREDPLEYRYRGADRVKRLKALKQEFDPTGVFTKELL